VELDTEEGLGCVDDTFIGVIVSVDEKRFPQWRKSVGVYCKSVVLWSNVAAASSQIDTWLVHTTVSVFKFVSGGSGSERKELISKTDTENWLWWFQGKGIFDGFDGLRAHSWVTWSVGEEKSFPFKVVGVGFKIIVE
jgi:hypothetical protein